MWGIGRCPPPRAATQGFTLIEMLVTLAVLSLVIGIVFPSVEKALRRQDFLDACARTESLLRKARASAIGQGRQVRVRASADRHGLSAGTATERFPATTIVTLPLAGFSFFPDGSVRGGAMSVADRGLERRWSIETPTGAIIRQR